MKRRSNRMAVSEGLGDRLRRAGLRATHSRLLVLEELRRRSNPASHADVAGDLERTGLDRATIYRNLLDLVRAGLARRTDFGDHVWRFEALLSGDAREHPHFLCNGCGAVECLDGVTVASGRKAHVPRSLREDAVEILVKGVCDRCHG